MEIETVPPATIKWMRSKLRTDQNNVRMQSIISQWNFLPQDAMVAIALDVF